MMDTFDFTTGEILDWELEKIHNALLREEVGISRHAKDAARDDNISLVQLLESILIGTAISKDLPNNLLERVPGINYKHQIDDRWIRVKVAWFEGYVVVTAYEI